MSNYTLSVLVSDQPGVLARVASLFSRRGFNIESLAVGPTERASLQDHAGHRGDDVTILEQLVKQLNKLIEVYKVIELEPNSVQRQLILVKVRCNERNRSAARWSVVPRQGRGRQLRIDHRRGDRSDDKMDALITMLEP